MVSHSARAIRHRVAALQATIDGATAPRGRGPASIPKKNKYMVEIMTYAKSRSRQRYTARLAKKNASLEATVMRSHDELLEDTEGFARSPSALAPNVAGTDAKAENDKLADAMQWMGFDEDLPVFKSPEHQVPGRPPACVRASMACAEGAEKKFFTRPKKSSQSPGFRLH